jgi:hypothetical protein
MDMYSFRNYPVIRKLQLKTYRDFGCVKTDHTRPKKTTDQAPEESKAVEEEED